MSASGGSYGVGNYTSLTYRVPAGLELRSGAIYRTLTNSAPTHGGLSINQNAGTNPTDIWAEPRSTYEAGDWYVGNIASRGTTGATFATANRVDLIVGQQTGWTIIAACVANGFTCDWSDLQWRYRIFGGRMVLNDGSDPTVSNTSGSLATNSVLRGTESVEFSAADVGSGVYRAALELDGAVISRNVIDSNSGRCASLSSSDPYVFATATPCKRSVGSGRLTFNTATASEGVHTVRVLIEDAGGNQSVGLSRRVEVDNLQPPTSTAAPRIDGTGARVGVELSATAGSWSATPSPSLSYQWFRCPAGVTNGTGIDECEAIDGARTARYTPSSPDAYKRVIVRVLAHNSQGSTPAFSSASRVIADEDGSTTSTLPVLVTPPAINGAVQVGRRVTTTHGGWRSSAIVSDYTFQWRVDGNEIAGATSSWIVPMTERAYGQLSVVVTASNRNGSTSTTVQAGPIADADGHITPRDDDRDGQSRDGDNDDGGRRDPDGSGRSGGEDRTPPDPPSRPVPGPDRRPAENPARFAIDGLKNPVAGPAHTANGTGASENARGRAAFIVNQKGRRRARVTAVRSTRNKVETVRGRLLNSSGKPIAGARLVAAWRQDAGGRWTAKSLVKTNRAGRFTYRLPAGPSRAVKFAYFAFSDSRSYTETNTISQKVSTPISLRIAPRAARNGRAVRFTGSVARDGLPKRGVLVTLEARYPGARWKQFKVVRTTELGTFKASYRFSSTTTRTAYSFRARAAKQASYPFERGLSRHVTVLVTP